MGEQVAAPNSAQTLDAYQKYLPSLMQETAAGTPGIAQAGLASAQQTQPGYNALNLQQLRQYGIPEAQVGQQIANSNALAGAQTNLNQLNGPGGQAANAALNINRATNAPYYNAANAASRGASSAVDAINLNGLSPGESNAIERSLNQTNQSTGNNGLVNPLNTVSNAMNFGGAYNNKIPLMNSAVNAASGAAGAASGNGGFNGVNVALGQPNTSTGTNFGAGQFQGANAGTNTGAANSATGMSNNIFGNMSSLANANTSAQASIANATSPAAYASSTPSCCFIFLESYHGVLPRSVRIARDRFYKAIPQAAVGYKKMAKWLVPLMQENYIVRSLVWKLMVNPLTKHSLKPSTNRFAVKFWITLWANI